MSADIFTVATQLAILQAGRTPVWATQSNTGSNLPPASAASGVPLQSAVRTLVHVSLRQDAHNRSGRLTIPSATLSGIYTVTINGIAVTFNAAGAPDLATVINGIAAAIVASGPASAIVTASAIAVAGAGPHDAVSLVGVGEDDWSLDFGHSGAAVVVALADLTAATLRLWWAPGARVGSTPPQVWTWSGETYALDRRGIVERFDSAGLDRLFLQVSDRIGHAGDGSIVTYGTPVISIGPCLSEVEV